jgi:6-phosphogluconolactonase
MPTVVKIFSDTVLLSHFAADLLAQIARQAVAERGRCLLSLSGGGTPASLYRLMAQTPYYETMPWERMYFFWGDERCVVPDDPESCYKQAVSTWLGHVPLTPSNIYRAKGELGPLAAALDYAIQLKSVAEPGLDWPRFDFVLLGLGMDGHTASLFPGSYETSGLSTVAVSANYQDRPAQRVSLTPDVFNAARNVVFLATGQEKAAALSATLNGPRQPVQLPAQRIQPMDGNLYWLVDEAAASLLPDLIINNTSSPLP